MINEIIAKGKTGPGAFLASLAMVCGVARDEGKQIVPWMKLYEMCMLNGRFYKR